MVETQSELFMDISREEDSSYFLGIRVSAIVETIILSAILVGFNEFFGDGKRYLDSTPSPFGIVVILITLQYGMREGLMAVVISILCSYLGNIPAERPEETLFDYQVRLAWKPVVWFITAFIVGHIIGRYKTNKQELLNYLKKTEKENKVITEGYLSLKAVKENLEVQLAGQLKTAAATFKAFKSLGYVNPSQILMNLSAVVVPILNPKKFSVYFLGPNGFEPVASHGWSRDEKYKRRFEVNDQLYQSILSEHKILTIMNQDDERILDGEGVLAAPLIDSETHEIFGMIKIEEMEFQELNISSLETFKTLCELIGLSYNNAKQHKYLEENAIFSSETAFFSHAFYKTLSSILEAIAKRLKFPLAQINIKFNYHPSESEAEPYFVSSVLYLLLKEVLPSDALTFHGKRRWMQFIILLPGNNEVDAQKIQEIIELAMKKNDELSNYQVMFEIEMLH